MDLLERIKNDPLSFNWRRHGIGFIKANLGGNQRVHVYNKIFLTPNITIHHDHPWHLASCILKGRLFNTRYVRDEEAFDRFNEGVINCCDFKGIEGVPTIVGLRTLSEEQYLPGSAYTQADVEIHSTRADDGTVTLVEKIPSDHANGTARVFWPVGSEYVNADITDLSEEEILTAIETLNG